MHTRTKRERISELFVLAEVTANRIVCGLNSKSSDSDLVRPWDFFPDLFEGMEETYEEQKEKAELEEYKARMSAHIERWNKRFEEAHQNDS